MTEQTAGRTPARRDGEKTVAGRHRAMRRADREITDQAVIREIIDRSPTVHVAYQDAEGLTIVPMDFGYATDESGRYTFYLHSAHHGRKIDAMIAAGDPGLPVALDCVADGSQTIPGRTPCSWGRAFASIVATGTAHIVTDADDAKRGLSLLMAHEAGMQDAAGAPTAAFTDQMLRAVTVWRIDIDYLTAKSRPLPTRRPAPSLSSR